MPPKPKKKRSRLDDLLLELGEAETLELAKALILTGNVLVNETPIQQAGTQVSEQDAIRIRNQTHPYVSRGALKLEAALKEFKLNVLGKVGLDLGASTGGFTEILLLHGAEKVYSIDSGQNQLDWRIRKNPKVVSMEKTNARSLNATSFSEPIDIVVMDLSFTSVTGILPVIDTITQKQTPWIVLIKPQFELPLSKIGKGGVVTQEHDRQEAIDRVVNSAENLGRICKGLIESPIKGTKGNIEFLAYFG